MTTYIVGCEYIEYDSHGTATENDDPLAGQFPTFDEATAFAAQLKSDPNVFKTYIQKSDAPL